MKTQHFERAQFRGDDKMDPTRLVFLRARPAGLDKLNRLYVYPPAGRLVAIGYDPARPRPFRVYRKVPDRFGRDWVDDIENRHFKDFAAAVRRLKAWVREQRR